MKVYAAAEEVYPVLSLRPSEAERAVDVPDELVQRLDRAGREREAAEAAVIEHLAETGQTLPDGFWP